MWKVVNYAGRDYPKFIGNSRKNWAAYNKTENSMSILLDIKISLAPRHIAQMPSCFDDVVHYKIFYIFLDSYLIYDVIE